MTPLRIAFVEWPDRLSPTDADWVAIRAAVAAERPDILVTNELPFGPWLADSPVFSREEAQRSLGAHEAGLAALADLDLPAVISSRPVWNGQRLANEAFVLEAGVVRALHRKQYFPDEPGWFERAWYAGDGSGFDPAEVLGLKIGVLLCTEAMFNERARTYGRQGAALIVMPRASGVDMVSWSTAGAMASLVAGAYVVSSNRVGCSTSGTAFGGGGFAFAPQAELLSVTTPSNPLRTVAIDPERTASAQRAYPCYVADLD